MKKQVIKIVLALNLIALVGFSQEGNIQPCNTYAAMESVFAQDPAARAKYEAAQKIYNAEQIESEKNLAAGRTSALFEYTVPVVFHILYTCEFPGVSDATCIAALQQVNSDYARMGSDTNMIFTPFKSLYVPSDIKFMLAKKDPSGNCTSGIVRHYDTKTQWEQGQANVVSQAYWTHTWDPTKYLNIYVVESILPPGTPTPGVVIVGYTFKPNAWGTGDAHEAIIYNGNYLSGSQSGIPRTRNLSHEIGHWLNLDHTFGGTNNPGVTCGSLFGGDNVSDTPDTKGNFSTCAASSTNTAYTCTSPNPTNSANYYQNVQNFMDYSSCARNFTQGQTTRMRNALNSSVSGRNNLSTTANLAFTDVNGPGLCAPKAEFLSTNCSYTVCSGSALTFKDLSSDGTPTSYSWSTNNGGIIANQGASLTSITFPSVGIDVVNYTVSNAQGTTSTSRTVNVLNGQTGIIGNYNESFEGPGVPTDWVVINPDNDPVEWAQTNNAAYDGINSFYIEGATNDSNNVDILQMPVMDILHNQSSVITFAYAYRRYSATHNDLFKVQASKDCGGTWQDVWVPSISTLAYNTGGVDSSPFYPLMGEWATYTLTSSPYWSNFTNSESVTVRFYFKEASAGYGNNMFIDAVNFTSTITGINELTKSILFNVYPNPTNGETNVSFRLNNASSVQVTVVDMLGRNVVKPVQNTYEAGAHAIAVNKDGSLPKGVYFVTLSLNGAKMSAKLVVN
jgi:hypothetical protein